VRTAIDARRLAHDIVPVAALAPHVESRGHFRSRLDIIMRATQCGEVAL
jgi:hypothetical protein